MSFCLAPVSRITRADEFYATIIAVDDGNFCTPFTIEAPPTAKIVEFQEFICTGLRLNGFIGRRLNSGLDILPLPQTPTLADLQKDNITDLHYLAQQPKDLSKIAASEFFSQHVLNGVHFLVWLPPDEREFLWLNLLVSNI